MWAAGDYADVARLHAEPARALVARAGVVRGQRALDVATGTGNTAILMARAGARVVGLDLTPELLALAEERAGAERLDIEWREGDAEMLPFEDGHFDLVVSSFGVGWAPHHEIAARELVRVLNGGGTLGLCHWSATGNVGRSLQVIPRYLPPSPNASRAWMWGDESYLEELFAGVAVRFEFERATTTWEFGSLDELMAYMDTMSGPLVVARRGLEALGSWVEARAELEALWRAANIASDGTWRAEQEYLLAIGRVT
jgi:SAM-dependent methyltransferase